MVGDRYKKPEPICTCFQRDICPVEEGTGLPHNQISVGRTAVDGYRCRGPIRAMFVEKDALSTFSVTAWWSKTRERRGADEAGPSIGLFFFSRCFACPNSVRHRCVEAAEHARRRVADKACCAPLSRMLPFRSTAFWVFLAVVVKRGFEDAAYNGLYVPGRNEWMHLLATPKSCPS